MEKTQEWELCLSDVEFVYGKEECERTLLAEYESTCNSFRCNVCDLPTVSSMEWLGTGYQARVCLNRKCELFRIEYEV